MGDGDDADAAAMAQMMGFSAFGVQDRPQKKRRYNPLADAATEHQPSSKQQHHHQQHRQGNSRGAASSTGSNATPLGATKRGAGGAASVHPPPPTTTTNTDEISLDDDEEADVAGDDAAVAAAAAVESTPIASLPRPAGLPERPAPGVGFVGMPPRRGHGELPEHTRDGGPSSGKAWYEDYYDPSSNENPWERLESSMGLSPRGSWLSRGHQHATTAAQT